MESSGLLPSSRSACKGEVDHQDGVLLDDTDQQDDADQGYHREFCMGDQEHSRAPTPAEGKVERIVSGVNVVLIENAQNDINGDQSSQNQAKGSEARKSWKAWAVPWNPG